jgi:hypothetical protein
MIVPISTLLIASSACSWNGYGGHANLDYWSLKHHHSPRMCQVVSNRWSSVEILSDLHFNYLFGRVCDRTCGHTRHHANR